MKPGRHAPVILLALTTLGAGFVAWRQYGELVELRAAALDKEERADWQRRLWELQKANRELQAQLAALRAENGGDLSGIINDAARGGRTAGPEAPGGRGGRGPGRGPNPQQIAALRELIQKPEVLALWGTQQKAAIDARYAPLFRSLNLSADQQDKLKSLLAERQTTLADVFLAAQDQGIDPRTDPETFRKLVTDAQNQVNSSIKATIGDAGFAQLQTYEQTMPQRAVVNQLQNRLAYTDTPLTPAQADQLVTVLAANTPPGSMPPGKGMEPPPPPPGDFGGRGGPGMGPGGGVLAAIAGGGPGGMEIRGGVAAVPITSNAVAQAAPILAPPQLQVLQQIQQQQQAQQQLQQIVRETMAPPVPAAGATSNGTATPQTGRRPGGR